MKKFNREAIDETFATMYSNPVYSSSYLFYATMVGQCHVQIREDLPAPAGVTFKHDKYMLFINPEKFNDFSIEVRLGIIKHEMLHILNGHLTVDRIEKGRTISVKDEIKRKIQDLNQNQIAKLKQQKFKNVIEMNDFINNL